MSDELTFVQSPTRWLSSTQVTLDLWRSTIIAVQPHLMTTGKSNLLAHRLR